jgi:hypothetical protein
VQGGTSQPSAPLAFCTFMMLLAPVTTWEPHGVTLAGYCYAMRHGMKVQIVTLFVSVTCNVTALQYAVTLQVCIHLLPLRTVRPIYRTGTPLPSKNPFHLFFQQIYVLNFFKHAAHSPLFSFQNAVYFITLTCLVPVLFAFYIQDVLKFKCQIPVPKG